MMNRTAYHDVGHRLSRVHSSDIKTKDEDVLQILIDLLLECRGQVMDSKRVLTSVIQLTHIKDLRVKKIVYLYLSFVSERDSDVWLEITNSIGIDILNPSPAIRQAALSVFTDSHSFLGSVNDIRVSNVTQCLKDPNPKVRRIAVAGTAKLTMLFDQEKINFDSDSVFKLLSDMIYSDEDATVIVECLRSLQWCRKNAVKMDLLISLLERLDMVGDWTKTEIVSIFTKYSNPQKMTHEELFQVLNLIDPFLDDKYPAYLSLSCTIAMLHVSSLFEKIHEDVVARIIKLLILNLSIYSQDVQSLQLSVLNGIVSRTTVTELLPHFKTFLLLSTDSPFLKFQKLKLLRLVCNNENSVVIFHQLTSCCMTSKERELVEYAVKTFFYVHRYMPEECETFLKKIIRHNNPIIVDATIVTLRRVILSQLSENDENTSSLHEIQEEIIDLYEKLTSDESKCAFFWLLSIKPKRPLVKKLAAILKEEELGWSKIQNSSFKFLLLSMMMRFYFIAPKTFQSLLGKFLYNATKDDDLSLNRQGLMYYKLLKHDVNAAKTIFSEIIYDMIGSKHERQGHENLKGLSLLMYDSVSQFIA